MVSCQWDKACCWIFCFSFSLELSRLRGVLGVGFRLRLTMGAGGWSGSGMKEVISCWMAAWPGGVVSQASMLESWIRVVQLITSWAFEEVGSSGISAVLVVGRRRLAECRPETKYWAGIAGM